ncbi:bile acid:sodium symporter family protein [Robertmurraya sp. DFI.2.37]|uniref:bile acid:sodium symporter family protein n=1 Tax=Robertmurraya sp. DFI.2.37 TaxID=3031819 RepID=UPI001243BD86|nr:bile acid:sodium symporter family protein [Robertmurraya sp. DFI.2.37]MDF1511224.1 bile acid:sodium symporter family protein [Robertmurraya sp. DFI.2.37]
MKNLTLLNKILEKLLPFLTPASVVLGVIFSTALWSFEAAVPWIFAMMTFSGAINSSFKSLQNAIAHPLPILTAVFILHLLMPTWAGFVGHMTFPTDHLTITGFILGAAIPTGITSFIWIAMNKGNTGLALSIILIDTLLSPFIVPYSVMLFVGESVSMDMYGIMKGLVLMIVLPSLAGLLVNHFTKDTSRQQLSSILSPLAKLGIIVVVMINSASIAPSFQTIDFKLVMIGFIVFGIAFSGYLFSFVLAKILHFREEETITLLYTGGMRNISAGAVIAVSFFPSAVAVPVVIGMLFQQVIASFYGFLISKKGLFVKDHRRKVLNH